MGKRILTILILVAAAVALDLLYDAATKTAGQTFDLRVSVLLFWTRPLLQIVVYVPLLILGYSLIAETRFGNPFSLILIATGIAVLYATTSPPGSNFAGTRPIYSGLVTLSASRLGLTVHVAAFLVAVGIVRFLPWPRRPRA